MTISMEVLNEWLEVKDKIFASHLKSVFVLGGTDSGKTTFVAWLANQGVKQGKVIGIIDADVGQSDIGPPTTIGLGIMREEVDELSLIEPVSLYFVGDISPEGHLVDMVVGTKKLFDKALENKVDKVIIDTTGLVQNRIGQVLKFGKIKNIGSGHIVAIQRKNEIEHIIKHFEVLSDYMVHRIPASSQVRVISKEERANLRNKRFESYFKNSSEFELHFSKIITVNTPFLSGQKLPNSRLDKYEKELDEIVLYGELTNQGLPLIVSDRISRDRIFSRKRDDMIQITLDNFKNILVGLIDEKDDLLGLGIIEDMDFKKECMRIKTPIPIDSVKKVKSIKFSEFHIFRYL